MEPYFSKNYAPNPPAVQLYKQQFFIDVRDYIDDIVANNGNLEFTVLWSNGRHTVRRNVPVDHSDLSKGYTSEIIKRDWNDSLSIPPYEHVTQVELLGISCPHIKDENYFILDIPEFEGVVHSSDNTGSHEKFAVIYFDSSEKGLKGKDFIQKVYVFNPPLHSLNKIRVRFRKYGGKVLNLNNDFKDNLDLNYSKYNKNDDNTLQTKLAKFNFLLEFTIKA